MEQKGNNLVIQELKESIMSVFNNALKEVPVIVLELVVKDLLQDVSLATQQAINKEQQDYQLSLQQDLAEEELA